jgi:hypothetical protein
MRPVNWRWSHRPMPNLLFGLGCMLVIGISWSIFLRYSPPSPTGYDSSPPASAQVSGTTVQTTLYPPTGVGSSPFYQSKVTASIQDLASLLMGGLSPEQARIRLQEIRGLLKSVPSDQAVPAITDFLQTNTDASTLLEFRIGPAGHLQEAPSLRVWLLDCLGEIDRNAAADFAKVILSNPISPDEWAVSLRDYALVRTSSDEIAYVRAKARELIWNPQWQQKPSTGFLEAFDTIVHTRSTALTPDLAHLVKNRENRAVAHAAYLTLDRLVLKEPQEVLAQLAHNSEIMTGREQSRANYFARADVRDPIQRGLLETYLLDPRRTPEELQTFTGIYPNANLMISANLLTRTETPVHQEIAAQDRQALATVQEWMADPRFTKIQSHLQEIQSRLENFVQQAEAIRTR